ncbi:MerC domain-containing protein [Sandaracinobacteroides saxicola]|uniref:MerC domain-containing protein n=1 Tax=Sandaracinobacteroides saxicola TaxID=2759707 RepID=A0A7G5IG61_9SPHN|nr:MerC domain-containing protein [Sandaracinobacteroides saxicola]QMW22353.1 MerC domain-containing protein [Sandaracinobacteroides saxicola]
MSPAEPEPPLLRSPDGWAALLSSLCLVHCLALPLGALLLPTLAGINGGHNHATHWLLIALAAPVSAWALWRGRARHARQVPLALAVTGFALMALGASIHGLAEQFATVTGGLLVAAGHWINWNAIRRRF